MRRGGDAAALPARDEIGFCGANEAHNGIVAFAGERIHEDSQHAMRVSEQDVGEESIADKDEFVVQRARKESAHSLYAIRLLLKGINASRSSGCSLARQHREEGYLRAVADHAELERPLQAVGLLESDVV